MGSLLPGWNERAPGVAPKGFQEYSDEEEQLGYFAAYERMKKELKTAGDLSSSVPVPALNRRNTMPANLGRRSLPLKDTRVQSPISGSFKEPSPTFGSFTSFKAPPHLQRLTSMPVTAGERLAPTTPKGMHTPESPLAASPMSPNLDAYKTQKQEVQWWRNFDSAHLNEMPDVPVDKEKGYVPQYKVAGQTLHYRGLEEEPHPPIEAL